MPRFDIRDYYEKIQSDRSKIQARIEQEIAVHEQTLYEKNRMHEAYQRYLVRAALEYAEIEKQILKMIEEGGPDHGIQNSRKGI